MRGYRARDGSSPEEHAMTPKEAMALAIEQLNHTRIASTPGGIEQQEAAGQRTLIESNISGALRANS